MDIALETTVFFADSTSRQVKSRILGKCGTSRQVRGGIFRKCEAQPWWPGLADKSFLLDHDDTGAALGLHQIPDLLAIVVQRWDEERIIFRVVILLRAYGAFLRMHGIN